MTTLAFTIPGDVRGKGRPKFVRATGRTYTDERTASYENRVMLAAREALAGRAPFAGPVHLRLYARLCPAPSAPKKARALMLSGVIRPVKKPDLDNILKAVLDGLNHVAFHDDAQVVSIACSKVYAETSGVDVWVEEAA